MISPSTSFKKLSQSIYLLVVADCCVIIDSFPANFGVENEDKLGFLFTMPGMFCSCSLDSPRTGLNRYFKGPLPLLLRLGTSKGSFGFGASFSFPNCAIESVLNLLRLRTSFGPFFFLASLFPTTTAPTNGSIAGVSRSPWTTGVLPPVFLASSFTGANDVLPS